MEKTLSTRAGIAAVSCLAVLGGIFSVGLNASATPEEGAARSPILGFSAVPGEIFLEIHRDAIDSKAIKGSDGVVLAKYTVTNSGWNDIEINQPRFYAMADESFVLEKNIENVELYGNGAYYRAGYFVGNRVEFQGWITLPAGATIEFTIRGDIRADAKINTLEFEPDFTSADFVINSADKMGNDLALSPFNMTGNVQSLELSATAGGINVDTADNIAYARYYEGVVGTLTSPYIPEGAIMRNRAGIDVYIAKYNDGKRFMRLILSPSVFRSYQHLKWENVLIVNDVVMKSYAVSNYARVAGENKIWRLEPSGDTGVKREFEGYGNAEWGFDSDGLYEINAVDRDSYVTGVKIER